MRLACSSYYKNQSKEYYTHISMLSSVEIVFPLPTMSCLTKEIFTKQKNCQQTMPKAQQKIWISRTRLGTKRLCTLGMTRKCQAKLELGSREHAWEASSAKIFARVLAKPDVYKPFSNDRLHGRKGNVLAKEIGRAQKSSSHKCGKIALWQWSTMLFHFLKCKPWQF